MSALRQGGGWLFWMLALSTVFGADRVVVVAPSDADPAPGEYRTLESAVESIRQERREHGLKPAVIELRGGRHALGRTLVLTGKDSALTIRAREGEQPLVSGARALKGWSRVPDRPSLWQLDIPAVRDGSWRFRQLFLDGVRQPRARTPNEGFFRANGRLGTGSPITVPYRGGDLQPEWAKHRDAELILLMKWTDLHVPILGIDAERSVVTIPGGPRADWMDEADARYWVENVPEALDAPGEWTLERATGRLVWWPPAGGDPNQVRVTAPVLSTWVRIQGDPATEGLVRGVRFVGITFSESDYEMPEQGLISPQAAVDTRGAIRVTHAIAGSLEECRFMGAGGYGLELGRGSQGWRVVGNEFLELGAGGLRLGEPGDRAASGFDANHGHSITDNTLRGMGRIFAPAVGILVFHSGTNRIAHNAISDLYYTAISVGWNWGYQETPCRANLIEYNRVEQVGQGRLSDMGGIYTLGPQPGTVIRNNIFRNIVSYGYGGWGLYTDEGSSGILIENNVATGCKSAGFHQHYGRDNVVRFNLLAFNREHELMRTRVEEHRSFWFTNNVVVWDSGDVLGSSWSGTTNQFLLNGNLYFDVRLGNRTNEYRFAGQSWSEWRARGQDVDSVIVEPEWVDRGRPELGFRAGSSADRVGFRPEKLRLVGPRPPGGRD